MYSVRLKLITSDRGYLHEENRILRFERRWGENFQCTFTNGSISYQGRNLDIKLNLLTSTRRNKMTEHEDGTTVTGDK